MVGPGPGPHWGQARSGSDPNPNLAHGCGFGEGLNIVPCTRTRQTHTQQSRGFAIPVIITIQCSSSTNNIFDDLPALSAPLKSDLCDELDCYLSTDLEHVTDPIAWWYKKRSVYPRLYRMALDYLTIPGEFIK